jgi:hypothetical protein
VQAEAWLSAGYRTEQVDVHAGRVTFVAERPVMHERRRPEPLRPGGRHPAFGVWKGKVTLVPGYDYTQPAEPDWARVHDH